MKTSKYIYLLLPVIIPILSFVVTYDSEFLQKVKQLLEDREHIYPEEKVYVQTDKTYYMPGETIWFNGFVVNSNSHKPTAISDVLHAELIAPNGQTKETLELFIEKGTANGNFALSTNDPGGIYEIRAFTQWNKNFGEKKYFSKKLTIQTIYTPRLLLKLDFKKESYGPGNLVETELDIHDLENNPVADAEISYKLMINAKEALSGIQTSHRSGKNLITFHLPDSLSSSDVTLQVYVNRLGIEESISANVPITLNNITLQFFPEGGQYKTGVNSRIAFKALNEFGKGTDVEGKITDDSGKLITTFQSLHMGMGSVSFSPERDKKYRAIIEKPVHINTPYPLPQPLENGIVMNLQSSAESEATFQIHADQPTKAHLTAHVHGKYVFGKDLNLSTGQNSVTVNTSSFPTGIAVFTLFDDQERGLCERLLFVNASKGLQIEIETNKEQYMPREEVKMKIKTLTGEGEAVPARLSLSVVDEQLLTYADDKQDHILSSLLLSSELKGTVEEPMRYFDPEEENKAEKLDALLMTQGWRRFNWEELKEPQTTIRFFPEKTSQISGIVKNTKGNPVSTEVTYLEMGGQKRVLKFQSRNDGFFMIRNIDPRIPSLVLVKNNLQIEIKEGTVVKNVPMPYHSTGNYNRRRGPSRNTVDIVPSTVSPETGQSTTPQINIGLSPDVNELSEIVVIGYATQSQNMTGSVINISNNNPINTNSTLNIGQLLQGRLPGVTIVEQSGGLSMNQAIKIRGISSIGSGQQPLIIIDGVPVNYSINSNFNINTNLDPENIASIEVLKSAEATALYGKSHNGVILITTKKGNYHGKSRMQWPQYNGVTVEQRKFSPVKEFYIAPPAPLKRTKRTDFRTTVHWDHKIMTDEKGKAEISFYNNDAVSSFRIVAEGLTPFGEIGRKEKNYSTLLPISSFAKLPEYMSVEDELMVPVRVTNNMDKNQQVTVHINLAEGLQTGSPDEIMLNIPSGETKTALFKVNSSGSAGDFPINLIVESDKFQDNIEKTLTVKNIGFPVKHSFNVLNADTTFYFDINEAEKGTVSAKFTGYMNIYGNLSDGLNSIIREPYGCFEQVSSSNYPNILALQLMRQSGKIDKNTEKRALKYLNSGYNKLISYEIDGGGFEWFGHSPAHQTLTAYGLLQFMELSQVSNMVSSRMMDRTYDYLMTQRNGQGGFFQNKGKYGFSSAPENVNNAYIVYVLSEYKKGEIDKEFAKAYQEAMKSQDPYRMALMAMASFNLNKNQSYKLIIDHFREQIDQERLSRLKAEASIVRSYSTSLDAETLALITLALLKDRVNNLPYITKCISQLASYKKYGGYGNTQSTALSLKAITQYYQYVDENLQGIVSIDANEGNADKMDYKSYKNDKLTLTKFSDDLREGKNNVHVVFKDTEKPVSNELIVNYFTKTPPSDEKCSLDLVLDYESTPISVNGFVRLEVKLRNKTSEGLPMSIAEIGIPGGMSLQPQQLKALQEQGVFDYYEILDGKLVIYYRELGPRETKTIPLDLKAEVPGRWHGEASSAYLYYGNERKDWESGVKVEVGEY